MTLSEKIKNEFTQEIPSKTCCRRALAYGILYDAQIDGDIISIDTQSEEYAEFYRALISRQFSKDVSISPINKSGRRYFRASVRHPSLAARISALDGEESSVKDYMEFKCALCRVNFMRGIFVSRATLSFEPGNNHLEFRIRGRERARALCDYLTACAAPPKRVERRGAVGLYYKRSDSIEDVLNLMQANNALFDVMNKRIERDIIVQEQRAVNCESVNILKSVESAQRQLRAIEIIESAGLLDKIGSELTESARLRLENHSASLSELAKMHEVPITKSVLNNRFAKIIKMSENILEKKRGDGTEP